MIIGLPNYKNWMRVYPWLPTMRMRALQKAPPALPHLINKGTFAETWLTLLGSSTLDPLTLCPEGNSGKNWEQFLPEWPPAAGGAWRNIQGFYLDTSRIKHFLPYNSAIPTAIVPWQDWGGPVVGSLRNCLGVFQPVKWHCWSSSPEH